MADQDRCVLCGSDHISMVERVTRLEAQQHASQIALSKAEDEDKIQFQHLNNLRREVVADRELFVTRELHDRDLALVRGFVARQIAVWTLVAGAGIGGMLLILRIVGH